jgi:PAS domain S-box-containing protein
MRLDDKLDPEPERSRYPPYLPPAIVSFSRSRSTGSSHRSGLSLPAARGGVAGRGKQVLQTVFTDDPANLDLSDALEDLAAPAYVIDRDGRFRWLNRAYVELLGDLRGRPFVERVAPEHRQLARANVARKLGGKPTAIFDLAVFDRSGGRVTMRITSVPVRNGGGVVGVFGIGVPIARASAPERSMLDDLTPRQHEVLRLLAEGLETQEIARRLGVADETARNHIRALLRATGAHSRLEVVLMGQRLGIVGPHTAQAGHGGSTPPAGE